MEVAAYCPHGDQLAQLSRKERAEKGALPARQMDGVAVPGTTFRVRLSAPATAVVALGSTG